MSYEILSEFETVRNGGRVLMTFHYLRDGVQKSCLFDYAEANPNPPDPRAWLENLLAQGKTRRDLLRSRQTAAVGARQDQRKRG